LLARTRQEAAVSDQAARSKLASNSVEIMGRKLRATIAILATQSRRPETVIDNLPQGVCSFDCWGRLILSNLRYAEIYRPAPAPTLREITERQMATGTSPMALHANLGLASSINWSAVSETSTIELKDGPTIQSVASRPKAVVG
jgi:hypothetical protein